MSNLALVGTKRITVQSPCHEQGLRLHDKIRSCYTSGLDLRVRVKCLKILLRFAVVMVSFWGYRILVFFKDSWGCGDKFSVWRYCHFSEYFSQEGRCRLQSHLTVVPKFIVPGWGYKVNPIPESTISPSQGLWIWLLPIVAPHSKKNSEPMLSNEILHQCHFHRGNTC